MRTAALPNIVKLSLAIVLGSTLGVAISTAWDQGLLHSTWSHLTGGSGAPVGAPGWADDAYRRPMFRPAADEAQATPAPPLPAAQPAPRVRVAPPVAPPVRLATTLLVGGVAHAADAGPVALPSGTRLQLRLTPNRSGAVELHAINPLGFYEGAPLWTAQASAGSTLHSPPLRLQGERGLETLRVVLRNPQGDVLLREEMQLWHQ